MSDRIDHVEEAISLRTQACNQLNTQHAAVLLRAAQVHATLALAEQQRIANQLFAHTRGGDYHLSDADFYALHGEEKPSAEHRVF